MFAISISLVLGLLATGMAVVFRRRCAHRFGRPTSGYVCCLRCTRRFPIQYTAEGEWRIGKVPLALEPPSHPPVS